MEVNISHKPLGLIVGEKASPEESRGCVVGTGEGMLTCKHSHCLYTSALLSLSSVPCSLQMASLQSPFLLIFFLIFLLLHSLLANNTFPGFIKDQSTWQLTITEFSQQPYEVLLGMRQLGFGPQPCSPSQGAALGRSLPTLEPQCPRLPSGGDDVFLSGWLWESVSLCV